MLNKGKFKGFLPNFTLLPINTNTKAQSLTNVKLAMRNKP